MSLPQITNPSDCSGLGFGAAYQYVLNNYLISKRDPPLDVIYTPMRNLLFADDHKMNQEQWDNTLNNFVLNHLFPRNAFVQDTGLQEPYVIAEKDVIDNDIQITPDIFDGLHHYYIYSTLDFPTYFNTSSINVAIHVRTQSDDYDPSDIRELYNRDKRVLPWLKEMIKLMARDYCYKPIHFHLYSQHEEFKEIIQAFPQYAITVHKGDTLISDIHHMITSDVFIASKSSLSCLVNYYRKGITYGRRFWHALKNVTYIEFSDFNYDSDKNTSESKEWKQLPTNEEMKISTGYVINYNFKPYATS